MSVNVYWQPVEEGECIGKDEVKKMLENTFDTLPIVLGKRDIDMLRAMRNAATGENHIVCIKLITAIQKHGDVRIYGQY